MPKKVLSVSNAPPYKETDEEARKRISKYAFRQFKENPEFFFNLFQYRADSIHNLRLQIDELYNELNRFEFDDLAKDFDYLIKDTGNVEWNNQLHNFVDEIEINKKLIWLKVGNNASNILTKTQYVVWDLWLNGHDPDRIALALQKDISGINKLLKRSRERLRKAFDKEFLPKVSHIKKEISRL